MVLSSREKLLVGALIGLVLVLGLWFGLRGVHGHLEDLQSRVRAQEAMVQRASVMNAELARSQQPAAGRRGARTRSLIGYVEQLADRVGVRDRIQLNLLPPDSRSGLQGLDVKVERLSLDEMVNLLYTMEDAEYRLVVDQLELSPSFRDKDLLRLSMRVLARE
jgi:Type II secretion system (T2SS), protein M